MPESYAVKPDRQFLHRILDEGGEELKHCFQCATCSVVCELSNGCAPFPRKEMIWAQWGLKDRLVADPDVWVCHQCNDCSTRCPRGARPGDRAAAPPPPVTTTESRASCISTRVRAPTR